MPKAIIFIIIPIIVVGLGCWIYQSAITLEDLTEKEQVCINSGGKVSTSLCCKTTDNFPNMCLIGPCACAPENSHEVKICDCGEGKCFDENECVSFETEKEELEQTKDWSIYTNEKHGYSFKYPSDCFCGPMPIYCKQKPPEERPPECLCFLSGENSDEVFLQAFTGEKDDLVLADFSVSHYDTAWYNPPLDTSLIEWLKEKFSDLHKDIPDEPNMQIDGISAVKFYSPSSFQAYSQETVYFIKNDIFFKVSMLDVDCENNKELYDQILSTFKFIETER